MYSGPKHYNSYNSFGITTLKLIKHPSMIVHTFNNFVPFSIYCDVLDMQSACDGERFGNIKDID